VAKSSAEREEGGGGEGGLRREENRSERGGRSLPEAGLTVEIVVQFQYHSGNLLPLETFLFESAQFWGQVFKCLARSHG